MERVATFGERLKEIMAEKNISFRKLSDMVHYTPQTLNRYALGHRTPLLPAVLTIAEALGVDERWLEGYDVPKINHTPPGEWMVPIVGDIAAGHPIAADEMIEGWEPAQIPSPEGYVYLRVKGDSMINAGINDGDLVLIREQNVADNGDIVACIVDSEFATLKRFAQRGDIIVLQAENPQYSPIIIPATDFNEGYAKIVGVAEKLVRNLRK